MAVRWKKTTSDRSPTISPGPVSVRGYSFSLIGCYRVQVAFSVSNSRTIVSARAASDPLCRVLGTDSLSAHLDYFRIADDTPRITGARSELQPRLKRDHARTTIATQTNAQQSGRRRSGVSERTKTSLSGRIFRNAGLHYAGQTEIRMVEDIEELTLEPQLHALGQRKPFCQVEVAPEEIGTAQSIAPEISELAVLRTVAAMAQPCTRIHGRDKSVRIEPLECSRLGVERYRMVLIQRNAGDDAGELRPAALHDAVSVC